MTGCKPRRRKLNRNKIRWPGLIPGVVLYHRLHRHPGLSQEFQHLELRDSKGCLENMKKTEEPQLNVQASGLEIRI